VCVPSRLKIKSSVFYSTCVLMFMFYAAYYFTGIFHAVVRQISVLFKDNNDFVFCILMTPITGLFSLAVGRGWLLVSTGEHASDNGPVFTCGWEGLVTGEHASVSGRCDLCGVVKRAGYVSVIHNI